MRSVEFFALARIAVAAGILAWAPAGAQVQTSPDWNGWVRGVSGAAASKAELVLQANGSRYSAVAAENGNFRFSAPARGSYRLTVSFGGRLFRMAGEVANVRRFLLGKTQCAHAYRPQFQDIFRR